MRYFMDSLRYVLTEPEEDDQNHIRERDVFDDVDEEKRRFNSRTLGNFSAKRRRAPDEADDDRLDNRGHQREEVGDPEVENVERAEI